MLLVCAATAVLCIYTLHKVAGPHYRMARVLEYCMAGEPVKKVAFREGDQTAMLAILFNRYLGTLRDDCRSWEEIMDRAEAAGKRDPSRAMSEIEKAADEDSALSLYR